jgi:hypothetical protein
VELIKTRTKITLTHVFSSQKQHHTIGSVSKARPILFFKVECLASKVDYTYGGNGSDALQFQFLILQNRYINENE